MFVFVAVLTSCTNDDITISYATNFKINPATVITPFTFEMNPGELESFGSDHRLRVRLLTYNSDRKSTRLNSSHDRQSRMPSSA